MQVWKPLINRCNDFVGQVPSPDMQSLPDLLRQCTDWVAGLEVIRENLPWGRYLVHADPGERFNIQLDVFSPGYRGGLHAHKTWGMIWALRGGLFVEDWHESDGRFSMLRQGWFAAGCGQVFAPPQSDWHRVSSPPAGPQTVSIHIYGQGFDLDEGIKREDDGRVVTYKRGPFANGEELIGAVRQRNPAVA